jgi:hypothetical protein
MQSNPWLRSSASLLSTSIPFAAKAKGTIMPLGKLGTVKLIPVAPSSSKLLVGKPLLPTKGFFLGRCSAL